MHKYLDDNGLTALVDNIKTLASSSNSGGESSSGKITLVINEDRATGLAYSTDSGHTWTYTGGSIGGNDFHTFITFPDGSMVGGNYRLGIAYSDDRGVTWHHSNITSGRCIEIKKLDDGCSLVARGPNDSGIIYSDDKGHTWYNSNITSGEYEFSVLSDGISLVAKRDSYGIKYSADKGRTWQDSNITTGYHSKFTVFPDGSVMTTSGQYLKYSEDKGHTWQTRNLTAETFLIFPDKNLILASSPGIGIKRSVDKGVTWQDSNVTSADIYNNYPVPADKYISINSSYVTASYMGSRLVITGDNMSAGSYCIVSMNDGLTWQKSNIYGSGNPSYLGHLYLGGKDALLYGGVGDMVCSGIVYSDDGCITWHDSNITSGECTEIKKLQDNSLIASIKNAGIKYSTDKGHTWQNSNITSGSYHIFDTLPDGTLIAGKNKPSEGYVIYSTDNGHTWQNSNIYTYVLALGIALTDWSVTTDATGKIPDSYLPDWLLALKP